MKVLHIALNGLALAAMISAAPALAGKLTKSSRTVIRIDMAQQGAQPTTPSSVTQGTDGTQGLLLPAVQKMRAPDAEPRKGGVNVAAGDVNGDGKADVATGSSAPQASHSAKERAYGMNQNIPRPQATSTQGPYQIKSSGRPQRQGTLTTRKAGEGQF